MKFYTPAAGLYSKKTSVLNKSADPGREPEVVNASLMDLRQQLKKIRSKPPAGDTGRKRINLLNKLGMALHRSKPMMTEAYAEEARVLSERIEYKKGEAESNRLLGIAYSTRGQYDKGLKYFDISRRINSETGNSFTLAATYSNIGIVYSNLGRLDVALDYHMKALTIYEEHNDRSRIAHSMNCIGVVFRKLNDLDKAENYYIKALRIREELKDKPGLALSYNNMGIIAQGHGDLDAALKYHNKSLELKKELNDRQGMVASFNNIGDIHLKLEEYTSALEYFEKSMTIEKELSEETNFSDNCNKVGSIMMVLRRYDEALEYFKQGLRISTRIGARIYRAEVLKNLSSFYETTGDYEKAFEYFKEFSTLNREIFSENSAETITRLQVRYETEQQEKESELYHLRNVELRGEINDRKRVENELIDQEQILEDRVRERTVELQQNMLKLKSSMKGIIYTLSKIVESKDPYTSGHQLRVAELARLIAIEMGFSEEEVEAIFMISLVHDIGKISIPQETFFSMR